MGVCTQCPALGLTSCPRTKGSCLENAHRGSQDPLPGLGGKGKAIDKAMDKVCKAEPAPATGAAGDGKGDLERRGQGYLQSPFTNFNLLAQGPKSEGVPPIPWSGDNQGSEGFHVIGTAEMVCRAV